ncbi:MAG TPA: aspartyl/asparaginyl beta-hydroxylase domain-containing protein [Stellaceae bacterium]|nr:aspartyl/asparaginyl beta-hydroxylase domain-containing protein [Stellaceae bacterium]
MGFFYDQTANLIRQIYDSRIVGPPVLDAATHFPSAHKFAGAWREIRDEAERVAARLHRVPRFHEIMREQQAISANDGRDWRLFVLKAYGVEFAECMAACPRLGTLVATTSDILSASISFMAPRKHIPAHRGPFRGIVRFYLGLTVPRHADGSLAAVLKIEGTEYRIGGGEWLLWDDTYLHEVLNESDSVRSVLLLDVWRRDMPFDMNLFSRLLIAAAGTAARWRGVGSHVQP